MVEFIDSVGQLHAQFHLATQATKAKGRMMHTSGKGSCVRSIVRVQSNDIEVITMHLKLCLERDIAVNSLPSGCDLGGRRSGDQL